MVGSAARDGTVRSVMPDPFEVLGIDRSASVAEIAAARRRLAFDAHPDRGGDGSWMTALNAAHDAAVAHATGVRPLPAREAPPAASSRQAASTSPRQAGSSRREAGDRGGWWVEHDSPSFTIDALPVEAFEALVVVASWIGEVINDDPPYVLDVHLAEPGECWCRLELVPDAGSSTVSISVAAGADGDRPTAEEVRDTWVAQLNALGEPPP